LVRRARSGGKKGGCPRRRERTGRSASQKDKKAFGRQGPGGERKRTFLQKNRDPREALREIGKGKMPPKEKGGGIPTANAEKKVSSPPEGGTEEIEKKALTSQGSKNSQGGGPQLKTTGRGKAAFA